MNAIVKALKSEEHNHDTRVINDNRELIWSTTYGEWQVHEYRHRARRVPMLCSTPKLDTAVDFLLGKR